MKKKIIFILALTLFSQVSPAYEVNDGDKWKLVELVQNSLSKSQFICARQGLSGSYKNKPVLEAVDVEAIYGCVRRVNLETKDAKSLITISYCPEISNFDTPIHYSEIQVVANAELTEVHQMTYEEYVAASGVQTTSPFKGPREVLDQIVCK